MQTYDEWRDHNPNRVPDNLRHDRQGGILPDDLDRAKKADLVTFAEGVTGTRCGNCRFFKAVKSPIGFCEHKKMKMFVDGKHQCCAYWDSKGTFRAWEK